MYKTNFKFNMVKVPIGSILNQITKEKKLSVVQLSERMNKTRQQIYHDFRVTELKDDIIEKYALAFGIDKAEIYNRLENGAKSVNKDNDLLAEQMQRIEEAMREMFAQQLAVKDEQIKGLQRTVDVLLGKSECVTEETGKVIEFVTYEVGQIA